MATFPTLYSEAAHGKTGKLFEENFIIHLYKVWGKNKQERWELSETATMSSGGKKENTGHILKFY